MTNLQSPIKSLKKAIDFLLKMLYNYIGILCYLINHLQVQTEQEETILFLMRNFHLIDDKGRGKMTWQKRMMIFS